MAMVKSRRAACCSSYSPPKTQSEIVGQLQIARAPARISSTASPSANAAPRGWRTRRSPAARRPARSRPAPRPRSRLDQRSTGGWSRRLVCAARWSRGPRRGDDPPACSRTTMGNSSPPSRKRPASRPPTLASRVRPTSRTDRPSSEMRSRSRSSRSSGWPSRRLTRTSVTPGNRSMRRRMSAAMRSARVRSQPRSSISTALPPPELKTRFSIHRPCCASTLISAPGICPSTVRRTRSAISVLPMLRRSRGSSLSSTAALSPRTSVDAIFTSPSGKMPRTLRSSSSR